MPSTNSLSSSNTGYRIGEKLRPWFADEGRRNLLSVILSAPVLALSLSGILKGLLPFDIAWIAVGLCGLPIVSGSAIALIRDRDIKADLLVSIALIGSLAAGEYFAAGEVALIMAVGKLLEDATAHKARRGIERLVNLTPKTARVLREGREEIIAAAEVKAGDVLAVFAGETVAADGIVLSGESSVDQSMMTGESLPVDKKAGDTVISGTVNRFGVFEMRAEKAGEDSSLRRMIRLAEEADAHKAPIVRLADRWAAVLVAAALAAAILTAVVTGEPIRALTILVVFCPCAFILATPTAVLAGIGNAARFGILVRSGDALQRLSRITVAAFDKTGTLTRGKPEIIAVESFNGGLSDDGLLALAAQAEGRSEHPLGKAVCAACPDRAGVQAGEFFPQAGRGVFARADGREIWAGKAEFLSREGIAIPPEALDRAARYEGEGATVICVAVGGGDGGDHGRAFGGIIALADVLRETAKPVIEALGALGIRSLLLTGDNEAAAAAIASRAGIGDFRANMLPEDKMKLIRGAAHAGERICMIGDGINDALALKTASAGIAMGGIGSDIAVEAADAVLVGDNIEGLPALFRMARKSMARIQFNIVLALIWNALAVALSGAGVLTPVTAALVHNAGSVLVVVSSALLIRDKNGTRGEKAG
ncbi:MAG: cation-translocating P-type ATPase [Spirochaetaceae bacterium]|nr:cation-translocating P-type ATPase [Spirochaetaceae bacterium]